jgi:hypothetical protein
LIFKILNVLKVSFPTKINCIVVCTLICCHTIGQSKWPIPIYLEKYGVYLRLTNDVNLNDTAKIPFSEDIFFRVVLFDARGKSYFEAYKNNKLYEKGYLENSLDTLKKYTVSIGGVHDKKVKVIQYFQPLKNGLWYETVKGKLVKKRYHMGIAEN